MGREQRGGYSSSGRPVTDLPKVPPGPAPGATGRSGRPNPLASPPSVKVRKTGRFQWAADATFNWTGVTFHAWSRERAIRRAKRWIERCERYDRWSSQAEQVWP